MPLLVVLGFVSLFLLWVWWGRRMYRKYPGTFAIHDKSEKKWGYYNE